MIRQIPGPGTHPHDWRPDALPPRHDYAPHGQSPPRDPLWRRLGRARRAHGRPRKPASTPMRKRWGDPDRWRRYRGKCGYGRYR